MLPRMAHKSLKIPPESEAKDSSIVIIKVLARRNHHSEELLVLCKGSQSCQEPAVANLTLVDIKSVKITDEHSGRSPEVESLAYFLHSEIGMSKIFGVR